VSVRSLKSQVSDWSDWVNRHAIGLAISACTLLVLLGIGSVVAIARLDHVPAWWQQVEHIENSDPAVIERAEHLENAITTQLTMVRDQQDPQWASAINTQQANAWLEVRLIDTIMTHMGKDAWPSEIERVRIGIEQDQLVLGVRVVHASGSSIVWAKVRIELDDLGDLWAHLSSVHVGTTPMPARVLAVIGTSGDSSSRIPIGPGRLQLGDGRTAHLIALRISGGRIEVVMETRIDDQS